LKFYVNRDINPHIPQYISTTPWYFGSTGPTLKHQRQQEEKLKDPARIDEHYVRGMRGTTATRYRAGACENCGAMTHKKKDCLERPRRVGAKFSGEDFVADEQVLPNISLDYDGKRDRWNGYEPEMYKFVIDEHSKIEEAKRVLKEEKLKQDLIIAETGKEKAVDTVESDSDSDEDDKYADHIDMPGTKVDSKQRITVRNLRIREDTAKYLRNLDPESAYYDPKTRSMRDNPYKTTGKPPEELQYAGDNFIRYSGDTNHVSKAQLFAWQAYDKGVDVHLQAEPTKAELVHQQFDSRKEDYKESIRDNILKKYGGKEHLEVPPKELIFAQTENYVEYSRQGQIIKGIDKPVIKSIYEEDVKINNHTHIWGSFWQSGKWGYKCCHSFIKNSYCTGNVNKGAVADSNSILLAQNEDERTDNDSNNNEQPNSETIEKQIEDSQGHEENAKTLLEQHQQKIKSNKKNRKKKRNSSSDEESIDKDKLQKALEIEDENRRLAEEMLQIDERKRAYNSMYEEKVPTNEEIEAYRIKR